MHQGQTPEDSQGKHALRRGHVYVDDVVGAGRRDDDGQVDRGRGGVGVLLVDVVWRGRVGAVPPDFTNGTDQRFENIPDCFLVL